jgi:hypothetical protein
MMIPQYLYGDNNDLQRYFALLVQAMQTALSDNGWTVPALTTAQITNLIRGLQSGNNPPFKPVLPVGTIWYDTSVGKLKVLTTAAVIGVSDGITETITST